MPAWYQSRTSVKPIPVAFHIGPLEVHTYGIGLAITFWFAYRYFERRLRNAGYPYEWLTGAFLWIVVASIVGARLLHVLANWSIYQAHPSQILAIWQGGLSSFGGLLFGIPVGDHPRPSTVSGASVPPGPGSRQPRPHGRLGGGTPPRPAADGGRWRTSDDGVVGTALRR